MKRNFDWTFWTLGQNQNNESQIKRCLQPLGLALSISLTPRNEAAVD